MARTNARNVNPSLSSERRSGGGGNMATGGEAAARADQLRLAVYNSEQRQSFYRDQMSIN